jgi:hypothetical protein
MIEELKDQFEEDDQYQSYRGCQIFERTITRDCQDVVRSNAELTDCIDEGKLQYQEMGCFVDEDELDIQLYMGNYVESQEGQADALDGRFDLFDYLFRVKVFSSG